jgi:hypothetical protein
MAETMRTDKMKGSKKRKVVKKTALFAKRRLVRFACIPKKPSGRRWHPALL